MFAPLMAENMGWRCLRQKWESLALSSDFA